MTTEEELIAYLEQMAETKSGNYLRTEVGGKEYFLVSDYLLLNRYSKQIRIRKWKKQPFATALHKPSKILRTAQDVMDLQDSIF